MVNSTSFYFQPYFAGTKMTSIFASKSDGIFLLF
jgi:hypothetical protein